MNNAIQGPNKIRNNDEAKLKRFKAVLFRHEEPRRQFTILNNTKNINGDKILFKFQLTNSQDTILKQKLILDIKSPRFNIFKIPIINLYQQARFFHITT